MLREPALVTAAAVVGLVAAAPSGADNADWGLNGTYIATSNGEWARKNEVFFEQPSLRSTWTISTECSYPGECTGTVVSEWGWTAPIYQRSGVWYVKHTVADWIPCPDGSTAAGLQVFRFKAMTPNGGMADPASTTLVGEDITTGVSGACGVNKPVYINMPFKLVRA
ncbi:Rv2253/PknI dimerization domain-containing protein [Mycolicibacterium thermoresistibile]